MIRVVDMAIGYTAIGDAAIQQHLKDLWENCKTGERVCSESKP
jgi:hypothetical protein